MYVQASSSSSILSQLELAESQILKENDQFEILQPLVKKEQLPEKVVSPIDSTKLNEN